MDHDESTAALAELSEAIAGEILTLPDLIDDPEWDTYAMVAEVDDSSVSMTAYRYTESGPPVSSKCPRNSYLFIQLRDRTRGDAGQAWDIAIVKIHRDTAQLAMNFELGDTAEPWRISPANVENLAELLRPRPEDFATA